MLSKVRVEFRRSNVRLGQVSGCAKSKFRVDAEKLLFCSVRFVGCDNKMNRKGDDGWFKKKKKTFFSFFSQLWRLSP